MISANRSCPPRFPLRAIPLRAVPSAVALLALLALPYALVPSRAQAQGAPASGRFGVPVHVGIASRRDVPVVLSNIGTVQGFQSVLVRARVDGTVDSIDFQEGQDVKPGDLLAQIDPRPYQATLDQAIAKRAADQAQLVDARLNVARDSHLLQNDFATHQTVDAEVAQVATLLANIASDEAAIAAAKLNLDFTRITAPLGGRVGLRMVDPGNLVHATDQAGIVSINQIHPIAVVFPLPQDTLPAVQAAMRRGPLAAQALAANDSHLLSTGTLLTLDNNIDQTTGTYRAKAVFANSDDHLWPGQYVMMRLVVDTLPHALTVPSTAIEHGPDGLYVYVVKPDNSVAMQNVAVRQDDGQYAVVTNGLADGTQVVTDGQSKLQDGSHVAISRVALTAPDGAAPGSGPHEAGAGG